MSADGPLLIAYDGSDAAARCIAEAAELFPGRRAVVVTVWDPTLAYAVAMPMSDIGAIGAPVIDVEAAREADQEVQAQAERIAAHGAELARSAGLESGGTAVPGETRVAEAIVEEAERIGAAVIVVGSRGVGGLRARMEGSTSNAVIKHAACPVLVVHHD